MADEETPQEKHVRLQAAKGTNVIPLNDGKAKEILGHLYPGEPVFIFRAKDLLSIFALDRYAEVVERFDPGSPHLASIVDALGEFREWQRAHPSKVKLPD